MRSLQAVQLAGPGGNHLASTTGDKERHAGGTLTDFHRLTGALDGNLALQRRAALAALSLTLLSGEKATTVQIGARIVISPGTRANTAFTLAPS